MHGPLNFRNRQKAKIFKVDSVMDSEQKTSYRAICKWRLVLTVRGDRRLRRIVRSQRIQAAQITSQLNDGASSTVNKWIVQRSLHRMDFGSRRPTRVPLLNALYQTASLAWTSEHRDWSVEARKRVTWSDESQLRLLNVDGRPRI
ncbi:HTH_Tnp_Tc3_2 domain-containing protein [Trichonephila clavipes]|nr:HTH_Tnp_Tc3_2 domain-containing protein [Trichonephila clavipes]